MAAVAVDRLAAAVGVPHKGLPDDQAGNGLGRQAKVQQHGHHPVQELRGLVIPEQVGGELVGARRFLDLGAGEHGVHEGAWSGWKEDIEATTVGGVLDLARASRKASRNSTTQ